MWNVQKKTLLYPVSAELLAQNVCEQEKNQKYLQTEVGRISNKDNFPESSLFIDEKQTKRSAASFPQSVVSPTSDPSTDLRSQIKSFLLCIPKLRCIHVVCFKSFKQFNSCWTWVPSPHRCVSLVSTKPVDYAQIHFINQQNRGGSICAGGR